MSNKTVSIIIVTAGLGGYLKSCLDSIIAQAYQDFEIVVIDNSGSQDFAEAIKRRYPSVRLYSSLKNLFYCQALNKGIEISNGGFILCLNDDVILDKRFIEEALKGFDIDQRIAMVSGKILRSAAGLIDSTGLFLSIWRTARERGYGKKDAGQYDKPGYIFGVNGAVAFYRRNMLENIKSGPDYFDSSYRIFYEDLDIAWRAQNSGWKGYYIPKAIAYHARGGTVRQGNGLNRKYARRYLSDERHYDLIKNRYLTLAKNESLFSFLWHLPFIILYDIFIWSYILFFKPSLIKIFFLHPISINSAFRKRSSSKILGTLLKLNGGRF